MKPHSIWPKEILMNAIGIGSIVCLMMGCSATSFLNEGESFYTGSKVKIVSKNKVSGQKGIQSELKELITPEPNATFLGSRIPVWFYFMAGTPKKEKGFRHFVKTKLGSPPVLLKDATPEKTAVNLENQLNNDGYFRSTVSHETHTKKKKSSITYRVALQRPYTLGEIKYSLFDTTRTLLRTSLVENILVKTGQRYQLERLEAEQQRIQEVLQNQGFFYFDDRHLLFIADSTVGSHTVDLELQYERGIPAKATQIYHVKTVTVLPDYILGDSIAAQSDTLNVNRFLYIDSQHFFRPEIITDAINLEPDSIYKRVNHEYTLSRLMSLKAFKYVNIKYTEDKTDSSLLHARVYLTPLQKKSIRMQVQVVSKSNNFVGPGVELTFNNRNFLRGAEIFQLKLHSSYEWQISQQQAGNLNSFEIGASAGLQVPRFTPFHIRYRSARYLPQTQFKLGYDLQQRMQYFSINTFNAGYGFIWRETMLKTHELFPIDINYVKSKRTSAEFDSLLMQNPTLANSFQNQFIIGSRYAFTLNTQLSEDVEASYHLKERRKYNFYLNVGADVSGNLLHAIQSMNKNKEKPYYIFNTPYSQYVKADLDFRYYYQFDTHTKLATRFFMGAGYAMGNSSVMPYIKQFSSGGSNSIRAFPARSVGPGTYNVRTDTTVTTSTYFLDQRADIKLEANVELRFDIYNAMKGAVFFDAGNIWLFKEEESRPGGEFNTNAFLSEIAVGTGFGLRYDFKFFVLRFDLAMPLRKPYLEEQNRWVVDEIDFGSSDWRRKNLILNIAIGYPF